MNRIGKNFFLNVVYQILVILVPLITTPYISRIFGPTNVGIYSYTFSIANYFVLFAMLGISNLGSREIAKNKDKLEHLSKTFFNLYFMQFVSSIVALIGYISFIFLANPEYKIFFLAQIPYVISTVFDITWLFYGLEKFKFTVVRNLIVKILTTIFIFVLVKDRTDLITYTLILSVGFLISQLSLISIVKRFVTLDIKKPELNFFLVKKNITLFIPVIAVSVYRILSKVLLGLLGTITDVAYYENANKLVSLPLGIVAALGVIMIPRISLLLANNKNTEAKELTEKSLSFIISLSILLCFGLWGIAKDFVPFFFGTEFMATEKLIYILAPSVVFIAVANVIRTQILIPMEKDSEYVKAVILGAVFNVTLNILLIPIFGASGSAVATLSSEILVCLVQLYIVRTELNIKEVINNLIIFTMFGILAYFSMKFISTLKLSLLLKIFSEILLGSSIYLGLVSIFKRDILKIFVNTDTVS